MLYGKETLTIAEVKSALNSKELQRKHDNKDDLNGEGFMARGRTPKWESRNHRSRSHSKPRSKWKCFICHKEGHFKKDCPERKWKNQENVKGGGDAATVSDGYESSEVLLVAFSSPNKNWILDSGCSFHMCPTREWFHDFIDDETGYVLLGNNKECNIQGRGNIKLRLTDGCEKTISDVRLVPELKRNLISVGMLDSNGFNVKIEGGTMKVNKGSLTVMKGLKRNGLYILEEKTIAGSVDVTTGRLDRTLLWDLRLGHVSEIGLNELAKQNLLGGDKIQELSFCEECVLGKSCRVKFKSSNYKSKGTLDYIHSDLWGPSRVMSQGGARYFITIIDDYSRKLWVTLLKTKDQAFQAFKYWKVMIENQTGRKVKKLRTDNGLEYCSDQFNKYCKDEGVARHYTVARTPQQNGLVERMNRTILEQVRSMLLKSGLPRNYWAEAVKTACYLINRCPSSSIDLKTPKRCGMVIHPTIQI